MTAISWGVGYDGLSQTFRTIRASTVILLKPVPGRGHPPQLIYSFQKAKASMRFSLICSLSLASTALAGTWRRQATSTDTATSTTSAQEACRTFAGQYQFCRTDSECDNTEYCQFVTNNSDGSGCDGVCTSRTSSTSTSTPAPTSTPATCPTSGDTKLCRIDTDCGSGSRCQFVTNNADGSGCDGACEAVSSSSSSSTTSSSASATSSAPATCSTFGTTRLCRLDGDCGSGFRCQFVTNNADGSGCDGACEAVRSSSASSTSSRASASASAAPKQCSYNLDCPSTQYCNSKDQCSTYQHCRGTVGSCPGGTYVSPLR